MKNLKKINNALIEEYFQKYQNDKRYFVTDEALDTLYKAFPGNSDLKSVLLKVSALNALYNVHVYAVFKMAEHILSLKIDSLVNNGDLGVVKKIAEVDFVNRKFYSFSTKYCHWHNMEQYPIYDSFVDKILWEYQRQDRFSDFLRADLTDFSKFKKILKDFREHYSLQEKNLRKIDKFLWIYGKEMFP